MILLVSFDLLMAFYYQKTYFLLISLLSKMWPLMANVASVQK